MPSNVLLRHHFIEFFIRISEFKYKKTSISNLFDCIDELIKHLNQYLETYDLTFFRKNILETEPIEVIIKYY